MSGECANCGEALKSGLLSENWSLPDAKVRCINLLNGSALETAYNKCGDQLWSEARSKLEVEARKLRQNLPETLKAMPIASIHSPQGWEYEVVGLVTAQSVTGTGLFSDVTSAFTDLFGTQSGSYNAKLRDGEALCAAGLRSRALDSGANAIVAVDLDYAEVGGQRAMLMVCMTGTAIKLTNADQFMPALDDQVATATTKVARLRAIEGALQAAA